MKKVRSSLNLDLDLSLPRAGAPVGMFSLGWLPESPRRCLESCRSGSEYRITSYHVLEVVIIFWTATGLDLGGLLS